MRTCPGGIYADLTADGAIGPGERTLLDQLPNLGSPKTNWAQNAGMFRSEMNLGLPIRDAFVDPATGELINNMGFLRKNLARNSPPDNQADAPHLKLTKQRGT